MVKTWLVNYTVVYPLLGQQTTQETQITAKFEDINNRLEQLYPYSQEFFPDPSPRQITVNGVSEIYT